MNGFSCVGVVHRVRLPLLFRWYRDSIDVNIDDSVT